MQPDVGSEAMKALSAVLKPADAPTGTNEALNPSKGEVPLTAVSVSSVPLHVCQTHRLGQGSVPCCAGVVQQPCCLACQEGDEHAAA